MLTLLIESRENNLEDYQGRLIELASAAKATSPDFEILIICKDSSFADWGDLDEKIKIPNTTVLVLNNQTSIEASYSAGIEASIGDIVIMGNIVDLNVETIEALTTENFRYEGPVALYSETRKIRRRIIRFLSNKFTNSDIKSLHFEPMLITKPQISAWSSHKKRSKTIRLIHHEGTKQPSYIKKASESKLNPREFRESIRTILNVSPKLLRFASLVSLASSSLSLMWAIYVIIVKAITNTIEGWVTTNLQLAFGFFSISFVLAFLCEYLYQITDPLLKENTLVIEREFTSQDFNFYNQGNVEEIN